MLSGKGALVTGASGGIGAATAQALARAGSDVALHFHRHSEAAEAAAKAIRAMGRQAVTVRADVRCFDEVKRMTATVADRLGGIDILVNNAGVTRDKPAAFMTDEDWSAVIDTNLKGAFHCTKAISRGMARNRWGRIINVASDAGLIGDVMRVNYVASKAGLVGMTKAMARELAASHVTVNAVAPGYVETEMIAGMDASKRDRCRAGIPLGRFGRPEEVARAIVFFASPAADYITGDVFSVDGGMQMRH